MGWLIAGGIAVAAASLLAVGLCKAAAHGDRQLAALPDGPDGPGLDLLTDQPTDVARRDQADVDDRFNRMVAELRHPSSGGPQ